MKIWYLDGTAGVLYLAISTYNIYAWLRMKRVIVQVVHTNVEDIVNSILRSIKIQNWFFVSYSMVTIANILEHLPNSFYSSANKIGG